MGQCGEAKKRNPIQLLPDRVSKMEDASCCYLEGLVEVVLLSVLLVPFFLLFFVFFFVVVDVAVLVFCALWAAGAAIRKGTATAVNRLDITSFFIWFFSFSCGGFVCLNQAPKQQLILSS